MTTEQSQQRSRLGKILVTVGVAWIALFFFSNMFRFGGSVGDLISAFLEVPLFLPIGLLFVGRAMNRKQGRRPSVLETLEKAARDASSERPAPKPVRQSAPTRPRPVTSTAKPAPKPASRPTPVEPDDLAAAIGFDESAEGSAEPPPTPATPPSDTPMTSEEMIAEARKGLGPDETTSA